MLTGLFEAGCSPLGPSTLASNLPNSDVSIENFSGALPLNGSVFYSFSVVDGGLTYLSLVSLKEAGADSETLVTIGLGAPRGTMCLATNVLEVSAGGQLHLRGETGRGVHCAVVSDFDRLTADATFSLNIVRPK